MQLCKVAGLSEAHGMIGALAAGDMLRTGVPGFAEHAGWRVIGKF